MMKEINNYACEAKEAFYQLAQIKSSQKNDFLLYLRDLLQSEKDNIFAANKLDLQSNQNLDAAVADRLLVNEKVINSMCESLQQIHNLADPVGEMDEFRLRPNGLKIGKMRVPLGLIAIIYESRPNVTIDAAALCLKSGNSCLLRGGSEAFNTNLYLSKLIKKALLQANLPENAVQFVENTDRNSVGEILRCDKYIDVIIPRGGKSLVARVQSEAKVPVVKHLDGICHVYIDEFSELEKALAIAINAKTSRYSTCNTMETLLIHQKIAPQILPILVEKFAEKDVELRLCEQALQSFPNMKKALPEDWETEYLAPILSIKIVENLQEAINHINNYGSHHTDSIITQHYENAQQFLRQVDSSSVMLNASTRFADGFEYGLGAEIGISTNKLHARGPVGLLGLTTQKWIVLGDGQIR